MQVTGRHKYTYTYIHIYIYIYIHIYICIYLSPSKKCISQGGKIVNEGRKFIFRDIVQQVGEHTENLLVKMEARQRGTPGKKACGYL